MNQEINQIVKRYEHFVHIDDKEGKARIRELAITRPELQRLIAEIDIVHRTESDFDSNWNSFKELSSSNKIAALLFSISLLSFLRLVFDFANPPSFCSLLASLSESEFLNVLTHCVIWIEIQLPLMVWIMFKASGETIGLSNFDRASFINFDQVFTQKCIIFFDSPINCVVLMLILLIFIIDPIDILGINRS